MKNGFFSRFCGWKDKAYDALFAKKIEERDTGSVKVRYPSSVKRFL